ncbi:hypothetical protein AB9F35_36985, partial [Rhizobium leguminosarum]
FAFSGLTISSEVQAQAYIHVLIDALGVGDFPEREAAIKALVASKDPHFSQILQQLSDGGDVCCLDALVAQFLVERNV